MRVSDLRFHYWLVRRRLAPILAAVAACTVIAVVVALSMTPSYRATAKLLLEGQQIPVELARTTIADPLLDQIAVVEQEVTSRSNLLALSAKYHLYTLADDAPTDTDIVNDLRDRIRFERLPAFSGSGSMSLALFAISFDSPDRDLSASVVNDIASQVLSRNARTRAVRASETLQFFQAESGRLSATLEELEARIAEVKTSSSRSLPDSLAFRRTQQVSLGERIVTLDREEATLRSRQLNLAKLAELGLHPTGTTPARPELQTLAELNRALTAQLATFSETSPSVVALRSQIAVLRTKIGARQKGGTDVDDSRFEMEPDLVEIQHRLASIGAERKAAKAELTDLMASIDETPATERTLTALVRTRDNVQAQYNANGIKLAEASVGERIETGAQGTRFSVIEPALAPEHRQGLRRSLIAAFGMPIGLALGLGMFLARDVVGARLRRSQDVVKALDIQPLAVIPVLSGRPRYGVAPAVKVPHGHPTTPKNGVA